MAKESERERERRRLMAVVPLSSASRFLHTLRRLSASGCRNQLEPEFKLGIDLLLARVPRCRFHRLSLCTRVLLFLPAAGLTDVIMSDGNTLTGLPVRWSQWPAAWWSRRLTRPWPSPSRPADSERNSPDWRRLNSDKQSQLTEGNSTG